MRPIVAYVLFAIFALVGAGVLAGNCAVMIRWYVYRKHGSMIPALGGLLLTAGVLLYPASRVRQYAWIPFVIDPGCLCLFAMTLFCALKTKY